MCEKDKEKNSVVKSSFDTLMNAGLLPFILSLLIQWLWKDYKASMKQV